MEIPSSEKYLPEVLVRRLKTYCSVDAYYLVFDPIVVLSVSFMTKSWSKALLEHGKGHRGASLDLTN